MRTDKITVEQNRRSGLRVGCLLVVLALALGAVAAVYVVYNQWQEARATSGLDFAQENSVLNPVQQFLLERYLVQRAEQLRQPAGTAAEPLVFVIESGETANSVAQKLVTAGLLRDEELFLNYLVYYGMDAGLVAGQYTLNPQASMIELADTISRVSGQMIELSFLPGWRVEEMANYLSVTAPGQISAEAFLAIVQRRQGIDLSAHEFLANLPADASLEGYLFPDQYAVEPTADAGALVAMMLDRFDEQVTPAMRQGFGTQGLSLREALTLASIVEREAVVHEERPVIAGVFLNRLRAGMPLQADATVQYALGQQPGLQTWWKAPLDAADLQVSSPYNTYQVAALPPGPIANPSLESLQAVATPTETEFIYFVVDCGASGSGRHVFSITYEEHLVNVQHC